MIVKITRYGYLIFAVLFSTGILLQVFLVGLSLLGGRPSWVAHTDVGHTIGIFALLMVITVYTGQQPHRMKRLTWFNLVDYILLADVVIFLRGSAGVVAALHPVLAMVLFALAATLVVLAWDSVRASEFESDAKLQSKSLIGGSR